MSSYYCTFKIVLLGEQSVGKGAFTKRYCYNIYDPKESITIGVDFLTKTVEVRGKKIKLQIWDVGGEDRFRFLLPTYLIGANGAFILYDITQPQTLDNITEWSTIVRQKVGNIPIMLVGTNLDLAETQRQIQREYGIQLAEKNELDSFAEVSAKTGQNINKTFEVLIELMLRRAERSDVIKSGIEGENVKKQMNKLWHQKLMKFRKEYEKPLKYYRRNESRDHTIKKVDDSDDHYPYPHTPETMDDLLKKLLATIPEVKAAAIVSTEGLLIASTLPEGADETRIAAMTAALLSLSERAIIEMNQSDFDQLTIKGSSGYLSILQAGPGAVLVISTTQGVPLDFNFQAGLPPFFQKPPDDPGSAGASGLVDLK